MLIISRERRVITHQQSIDSSTITQQEIQRGTQIALQTFWTNGEQKDIN